jgi:dipeptidyl aminopeptidase/acylaminoacyl peptidase
MVTNIRLELVLFFLCLPFLAGRELAAQTRHESRQQTLSEEYGYILGPMMSQDGAWIAVRKRPHYAVWEPMESGKDTVMIFNLSDTGKAGNPIIRFKVFNMSFIGGSHLLLSVPGQTELLSLPDRTSIFFKNVSQFKILNGGRQFLLHYNEEERNRLELHDYSGRLLKTLKGVSRFYTSDNGDIYAITVDSKNRYEVYSFENEKPVRIFRSDNRFISLEADKSDRGVIICEQIPGNESIEVRCLDLKDNKYFSLRNILPMPLVNCYSESIRDGEMYFLRLWINYKSRDTSLADIWYENDNKLEEKFFTPTREVYYVWEPQKNSIKRIGNDTLISNVFTGSERYFLSSDPYLLQDYTSPSASEVKVFDRIEDSYSVLDTISEDFYISPDGKSVLYQKSATWVVKCIATGEADYFGDDRLQTPFFASDGKSILFGGDGALWIYDCDGNRLSGLHVFNGARVKILNATEKYLPGSNNACRNTFDPDKPLILELYDAQKYIKTYLLWKNGEYDTIIPATRRYIKYLIHDENYAHFSYREEDYNMSPRLVHKQMGKREEVLYQINKADKSIYSLKQEIVTYTDSDGNPLKGTLYYPEHYNSFRKYPMVVHIYAEQSRYGNRYLFPTYYENDGFNIRLLLENGYFVFLPDILIKGRRGPGEDALDCVNKALDALALNPLIDKTSIGLMGHSFGGYETDFIATHSDRFATYVSGSGHSDIIWAYHAFSYNYFYPEHVRLESGIYDMQKSFAEDKWLYFDNNPLYYADKVNSPVLLWSGKNDLNVTSDHSMAFYNALRRNGKDVVALYYKDEGHVLQAKEAQFDLTSKILDWFDYFLKGDKSIEWIRKGF